MLVLLLCILRQQAPSSISISSQKKGQMINKVVQVHPLETVSVCNVCKVFQCEPKWWAHWPDNRQAEWRYQCESHAAKKFTDFLLENIYFSVFLFGHLLVTRFDTTVTSGIVFCFQHDMESLGLFQLQKCIAINADLWPFFLWQEKDRALSITSDSKPTTFFFYQSEIDV